MIQYINALIQPCLAATCFAAMRIHGSHTRDCKQIENLRDCNLGFKFNYIPKLNDKFFHIFTIF